MVTYLGISLALCFSAKTCSEGEQQIKPVIVWSSTDSKVTKRGFFRFQSVKAWQECWERHLGIGAGEGWDTCPEVDFDSYMVLAIFQGEERSGTGLRVVEMLDENDAIRVRYSRLTRQTGIDIRALQGTTTPTEARRGLTEPELEELVRRHVDELVADLIQRQKMAEIAEVADSAVIVIARSPKALVFEEDVRTSLPDPPLWREMARVPRIEDE